MCFCLDTCLGMCSKWSTKKSIFWTCMFHACRELLGFPRKVPRLCLPKKSFLFNSPVSWVLLDELALRVYFIHEITLVVIVLNFWLLIHLKILNNYFNFKLLNELLKIILYYSLSHINYIHSQWCERLTNN
jgi:hypothetical protein